VNFKHGGRHSPEYGIWCRIKDRCINPRSASYPRYGGAGVTMCERWRSDFANFLADVGPRPTGRAGEISIDRIDNSRGYEPGNCRWTTATEQSRNRKSVVLSVEKAAEIRLRLAQGETQSDLARSFGVSIQVIHSVKCGRTWKVAA
jgi:hypothetical protein